jgi:hypothetical protein
MTVFIWGIWTPVRMILMPVSAGIVSSSFGYLPSRSRMTYRARLPASCRSMARLRAAWVTQAAVGWPVAPRVRIRRLACSITARTYKAAPVSVTASKKSMARIASTLGTQERGPGFRGSLGCGVDAFVLENLPDGQRGDLDAKDGQLAVDATVSPRGVLCGQTQDHSADGPYCWRPASAVRA